MSVLSDLIALSRISSNQ